MQKTTHGSMATMHAEHMNHMHHMEHHHDHQTMHHGDFKIRFFISLILTIPLLILSPMIQMLLHFEFTFVGANYVVFLLATIIFLYGGWPFLSGLFNELRAKNPGMMTLIGIAIIVAYFYSVAITFGLTGMSVFWELATLIDIMLLGHWLEMRSVMGASHALEALAKMLPNFAHLEKDANIVDVPLSELKVGDIILIKSSEKIPADGIVIDGLTYVNEAMLTGESKPIKKTINDFVIGGAFNGTGTIKIKIAKTGNDLYLNKIVHLVNEAQNAKSKTQKLADLAARWLTVIALVAGFTTLAVWLLIGKEFVFALERMVTVMVTACPHALGLAIPLVVAISTTIAARQGLIIRNRTAFENSRKITTVVLDKTGTLTKGEFAVVRYATLSPEYSDVEILKYAAAIEQKSEHPIALSVIAKAKEENLAIASIEIKDFQALIGVGVMAQIDNKKIAIVNPKYFSEHKIKLAKDIEKNFAVAETIVFVLQDEKPIGFIALADEIRAESFPAIQAFKKNNIKTIMLTGDNKIVAESVSDALNLDGFHAEVFPEQKLQIIRELKHQGEFVAMVGDGVNDAPALAEADVGIAIGSGTEIAAETADIILVSNNLNDVIALILFGKKTYRKMVQNLIWATGYNVLALPLAAGVLYPFGFVLNPAIGAVLMSLSTVIVAINAKLLKV